MRILRYMVACRKLGCALRVFHLSLQMSAVDTPQLHRPPRFQECESLLVNDLETKIRDDKNIRQLSQH